MTPGSQPLRLDSDCPTTFEAVLLRTVEIIEAGLVNAALVCITQKRDFGDDVVSPCTQAPLELIHNVAEPPT